MIVDAVRSARELVYVSSAFIKELPFEEICRASNEECKKIVVGRWQFRDLVSGASDLGAYVHAKKYGWDFYFDQDLHAKLYICDELAFIGSSNLTKKGLHGGPPFGNIELSIQIEAGHELRTWFDNLRRRACLVDDELFDAITRDVEEYKATESLPNTTRKGFSQNVLRLLKERSINSRLYLHDLPTTFDPNDLVKLMDGGDRNETAHDFGVLGLPLRPNVIEIKRAFMISPGFTWLLSTVEDFMFFGELSSVLHTSLCDEPKPYRSEVKIRLSNLINWSAILCPELFLVDRPNHSQRISRIRIHG